MRKRQRLGQHFLKSQSIAKKIVDSAGITKKDDVLEIGSGDGILIPLLCEKAKNSTVMIKDNHVNFPIGTFFQSLSIKNLIKKCA